MIQECLAEFRSTSNSANHIPTHIPTKSLAAPNKLEQGLSEIESFQEPIGNLPCV